VGLDIVAIPGNTPPPPSPASSPRDAIGVNNKNRRRGALPRAGRGPGEVVAYGGLLGDAIVMDVSKFSSAASSHSGGRIPAPESKACVTRPRRGFLLHEKLSGLP